MRKEQLRNSGILVFSNLFVNLSSFLRQVIMAWFLGVSANVDILLLSMIVPTIIQAMIGGGAGEILVIKREKPSFHEGSFEVVFIVMCLLPVILLGALFYLFLGPLIPFFNIDADSTVLFRNLSIIFLVNMIPGTFTSILRPHLYSRGHYGFYAIATIISQVAGLLLIIVLVKSMGIYAFAFSYLCANLLNALIFSFKTGLPFKDLFSLRVWKHETEQLLVMLRRVFSLGIQTFINYFATFWERSLSVKYLTPGYLSSLNYSKTLSEIPNAVLLSSILTTSYIEQVKLHKEDQQAFSDYTAKILEMLLKIGFMFQVLMLLFAPVIIILVFRRGRFDNNAVVTSLMIFNILTISFLPKLIMNFFSRTMYILGEYKKLLLSVIFRFIVQMSFMAGLITLFRHAIPTAFALSYLAVTVLLFYIVSKIIRLPGIKRFIFRIVIISCISTALLLFHSYTLPLYIEYSNLKIFLLSLPLIVVATIVFIEALRRNGIEIAVLNKIFGRLWQRKI